MSNQIIEMTKCRWREFKREPSAMFWVVFMPILWMVILGFAFSEERKPIYGVGWIKSPAANQMVLKKFMKNEQINLKIASREILDIKLKRGEINLIVDGSKDPFSYIYDNVNPTAVASRNFIDDLAQRSLGRVDVMKPVDQNLKVKGLRYVDFLIPGLLGLSIMTSSLFGVGMTIVANRRDNLLKRYCASPMQPTAFMISHVNGRLMVLAAEAAAVMLCGVFIFDFELAGSWGAFGLVAVLGAACFTAIALLCASRTANVAAMAGMTNLISLPMMMLSGVFFAKSNFPDWMQNLVAFLPLTAINDALRKIALEGATLSSLGFELAVMFGCLLLAGVSARKMFKWY